MAEERVHRRLAAVLAADVVGYSRLMEADEEGTLARLKQLRKELIEPRIAESQGRTVKLMGDGALVEFPSAVDAVRCAVDIQRIVEKLNEGLPAQQQIAFRIGINLGDIIVDGDDIYGDGVNIAARLEGLSEAGGVCVSGDVYRQVHGKVDAVFDDLGAQQVKNIAEPVHAYAVRPPIPRTARAAVLPSDKPSIAVLAFQNMSGDPEQEYFADGIVEDIITALSRMRWLFVIARNSSFTYKGSNVDVRQVGRELGVRYVLEGSIRKGGDRLRITAQLAEAATANHLWAEKYDGALEDVFDLQDQITMSVVGAIAPTLEQAEIERAKSKPTESLDAYDHFLRGMANFYRQTQDATSEAISHFSKAIELDPNFATAFGMAAQCYFWRKANGWMIDRAQEIAEGVRLARRAVELGKDDAIALARGGHSLAHLAGDLDAGIAFIDRALALNPNLAAAWHLGGFLKVFHGEPDTAMKYLAQTMRLSPLDVEIHRMQTGMAFAQMFTGRFDEASTWATKALREMPDYLPGLSVAAASHALAGRMEEASRAMQRLRQIDPALRVSNLKDWLPVRRPEDLAKWGQGMQIAGLPQ